MMARRVTAVDAERRAGDEVVGRQHHDGLGDIAGGADTAEQMQAGQAGGIVDAVLGVNRGVDNTGRCPTRDSGDADVVLAQFGRQLFGQAVNRPLLARAAVAGKPPMAWSNRVVALENLALYTTDILMVFN